jgi:hypothetical protein
MNSHLDHISIYMSSDIKKFASMFFRMLRIKLIFFLTYEFHNPSWFDLA